MIFAPAGMSVTVRVGSMSKADTADAHEYLCAHAQKYLRTLIMMGITEVSLLVSMMQ